ncbi:MAG: serine/threonine-protein phosphatase [Clostridiaceae bacterium]|jgi:serine/threonine protein phosphatase PrpC|nr:serine/threonine-protein phosphatase [Clostridiaceae bacterium]
MNFLSVSLTDIGISRSVNQDSICTKVIQEDNKKASFSIVCDGMGGLSEGEVASLSVLNNFCRWADNILPVLIRNGIDFNELKEQWTKIILKQNQYLGEYGANKGIMLGTTLTALLINDGRYYGVHVGDSRIYEIKDGVHQLTRDHTLVERDIRLGNITEEQAKNDPRKNILLQCVGASPSIEPEFINGIAEENTVYMLCSDGFRHVISDEELYDNLNSNMLVNEHVMKERAKYLIELNKSRMEQDNISVILVKTI